MPLINNLLNGFSQGISLAVILRTVIIVVVGYFIAKLLSRTLDKLFSRAAKASTIHLWRKVIYYTVFILFLLSAMHELGFDLRVLLGAAGVFTVAIGFASQTSISNLISGLFLIAEHPFVVGESITVNNITGEVMSVDLLSARLRTPDNTLVRIPNEVLLKMQFVNLSRFSTRRFDCLLNIAYVENFERVKKILLSLTKENTLALHDPAPSVTVQTFNESAVVLLFAVWAKQEKFNDMRSLLCEQIKVAFEKHKVIAALPAKTVYWIENDERA